MTASSTALPEIFTQLESLPLPKSYEDKAYKLSITRQLVIAFMLNLLSLSLPIMMLQVYDRIIPHQSYGTLIMLATGVAIALAFDIGLRIIRSYLTSWTAASHEHAASCAALDIFSRSDIAAFEAITSGEHLQNMTALGKLREFYSGQAWTALIDLPFAIIFLALIAYLGGILVLVPIALLAAFFINASLIGSTLKETLESRSHSDDLKASFVVSVLNGIHTAKALSFESFLLRRFERVQSKVSEDSYRVATASGSAAILSATFGQLSLILTATAGFFLVLNGSLSVGGLSACTLLAGRCIQPVQRVLGTWLRLQDLTVAREQAQNLFVLPTLKRGMAPVTPAQGRVFLEDVCYGLASQTGPFLDHVSLSAEPGEIVAITGDDGTAKSILLQIISGIIPAEAGTVRLDGVNPHEHSIASVSNIVGYLPQDGTIFKGTILENLTSFRTDDLSVERAKNAGEELGLDKIIDLMPRGYQTQLFDSAADPIPPGVKQRVALARVLANQPAILLFDDADRALDKDGYNLLFRLMGRFKDKTTIILVTQDQNLMSFADKFYHLDAGRLLPVARSGTQNLAILSKQY